MGKTIGENYHYYRVCTNCGYGWWGLHCPHDGYQNPCGNCDERPKTLPDELCECEFVINISDIRGAIPEKVNDWFDNNNQEMRENAAQYRVEGYNQAIDDIRQALNIGKENK